jgi:hypothetical protein
MDSTSNLRSLESLDTGKGSIIYWITSNNKEIKPLSIRRYLLIYLITIFVFYGVGLVWAAFSTPSLTTIVGEFRRPYLKDMMLVVMLFITLPISICIHLRERFLIPNCLRQLVINGVITESKAKINDFVTLWENRFKYCNIIIQILSLAVVTVVVLLNYKSFAEDPLSWQHFGARTNGIAPIGWWSLLGQIGVMFFVISIVLLRIPVIIWLLWSLQKYFVIKVRPLQPDGVGGLSPVARIAFQGQIFLTLLGINIALNYVVFLIHSGNQPWYIITTSIIAYCIIAPVVFIGPLLPFRSYMRNEKYKLLSSISNEYDNEINDIQNLLHSDESNLKLDKLEKLTLLNKRVSSFPEWPLDTSTLREFVVTLLIPAFIAFLSTFFSSIFK